MLRASACVRARVFRGSASTAARVFGGSASTTAGVLRTSASALLLLVAAGCGDSPTEAAPARTVQVVSPGWEEVEVGGSVPVAVRVLEAGIPVEGAEVRWEALEGGLPEPAVTVTGADGRAETVWQVGETAGSRRLRIRVEHAEPLLLEAAARAAEAASVRIGPDTLELAAFRERRSFEVRFRDRYGNEALPPASVRWEVLDPGVVAVAGDGAVTAIRRGVARVAVGFGAEADTAVVRVEPRGVVTITFDDGFRTTYSRAYPILDELGLRANVAVNPTAVDESWPDFMPMDQLTELHEAGWAMVSHTMTHANLTELSDAELEAELAGSRAWLEEHGFRGSEVFVVPFHEWGGRERARVQRHYEMARGTSAIEFHPDTLAVWIPDDPYALTAYEAEDAPLTTAHGRAVIRDFIERAVEQGAFLELFFHRVPPEMEESFRLTMEIVAEFSDDVVTYDEVVERFRTSAGAAASAALASGPPRGSELPRPPEP